MQKETKTKKEKGYYLKRIGWYSSNISSSLQSGLMGYLTFYLTDSVYLSAATVGIMLLISRITDGFLDIIAGIIIDKTKTRWGKARPYGLMYILLWASTFLAFSVPNISKTAQIIYVFIMYNLSDGIARTFILCSTTVHMKKSFKSDEQISIISVTSILVFIVSIPITSAMPLMISKFGQSHAGWSIIALIVGIPSLILGLLRFFFVEETETDEIETYVSQQKVKVIDGLKSLLKNKYIFIINAPILIFNIVMVVNASAATYYFTYYIGDLSKFAITAMFSMFALIGLFIQTFLVKKMGAINVLRAGFILSAVANLMKYIAPYNPWFLGICTALVFIGYTPAMALPPIFYFQCMKYGKLKNGLENEGLTSSIGSVANRVGSGLGAVFIGAIMAATGYDGSLAVQSHSAVMVIQFLYAGFPALGGVICFIILYFYDLEKKMPQIEAELKLAESKID